MQESQQSGNEVKSRKKGGNAVCFVEDCESPDRIHVAVCLGNVHIDDVELFDLGVLDLLIWLQRLAVEFQRHGGAVCHVEGFPAGVHDLGEWSRLVNG